VDSIYKGKIELKLFRTKVMKKIDLIAELIKSQIRYLNELNLTLLVIFESEMS